MTLAVEIEDAGLSYCDPELAGNAVRSYGRNWPGTSDATNLSLVRASRFVDGLRFKTDGEEPPLHRWAAGADVPDRVSHAVCLLALDLPSDAEPPPVERDPVSIDAGPASVEFSENAPGGAVDDKLLANRLGIPTVAAYRLLRPYLAVPEELSPFAGNAAPAKAGVSSSSLPNRQSLS